MDTLAPSLLGLRHHMQTRRDARVARLTLERELASYRTPSELNEWDSILARYDDNDAAEIREILNRNRTRAA
jgi:hypothetical protein